MAQGFKVADAFIAVHADDDTREGRRKIERDTKGWASKLGLNLGSLIGKGLVAGLTGVLKGLLASALMIGKISLLGLVIGTVATAVAGLVGALINLLPYLAELVQVAVAAAGALLLIPGAITTLIAVVMTLKLALGGVGEALKAGLAGDVEAFNAALEKLAPNAQEFVREIVRLKPAWDRLRMPVQNALFADLAGLLRQIAEVYLPILETGLTRVATVLNGAFRSAMGFLLLPGTSSDIAAILAAAATAAGNFASALRPLLQILRDVVLVSTQMFAQLTGGLLPVIQGWADTIAQMRADGSLAQLILDGVAAVKLFAGLAGDLLGILKGIFSAAGGAEGGGIFGFFERLNELINSTVGQETLTALFSALGSIATTLAPILLILAQALVPVAQGLALIAVAFQPGLMEVAQALGEALVSLVPAFVALAPLLSVIAQGFAPLAEIISGFVIGAAPGAVMLFDALVQVLSLLAPIAQPVGQALGLLVGMLAQLVATVAPLVIPILGVLAEVLGHFLLQLQPLVAQWLPLFSQLIYALLAAFTPLLPVLIQFIDAFFMVILANKDAILDVFFRLTDILLQMAPVLAEGFAQVLMDLIPQLPSLVTSMLALVSAFLRVVEILQPFLIPLFKALTEEGNGVMVWMGLLIGVINILTFVINFMGGVLRVGIAIWQELASFVAAVRDAIASFVNDVRSRLASANNIFSAFGSVITSVFTNLLPNLFNAGRNLIQSLIDGVGSMVGKLRDKISSMAQTVRNFWPFSPAKTGPLSGRGDMRFAGQNLVGGLVRGIEDEMTTAERAANALAGIFRPPGGGLGGLATAGAGGPGLAGGSGGGVRPEGDTYVIVRIGERVVTDMVKGEIVSNPTVVADAANEGNRQQADWSRKRTGDV